MPTFKHPCPHCGKYINRDVPTCPFCGTAEPFTTPPAAQAVPPAAQTPAPAAAPAGGGGAAKCTGCGAPLASGARFCTVCGTLTG